MNPQEHGTIKSYIIGFIASLIFTFIPYYLVTHHLHGGTGILVAILVLAVVQLVIQVEYFLHLGRGPKPRWEVYFFLSTISIILVVVGGSLIIVNNLHSNMSLPDQKMKLVNDEAIYQVDGKLTGACQATHVNYRIIFANNAVSPRHVAANKCDTLTFINEDSVTRDVAFGTHPAHESYAGISEFQLASGKTKTITLSESGAFNFHDHLHPTITGSFLVLDVTQGVANAR